MSTMANQDEWIRTQATIIACTQKWGYQSLDDNSVLPEYVVTFLYLADGQTFEGNYRANSPQECGHEFEILYDPKHLSRNTGSDVLNKRWVRMTGAMLGVIAVLIAIWFWGKECWFQ
jgi:hypothetical protein